MYKLSVKGVMRIGLTEVASFSRVLGSDISLAQAVERSVELLSGGYRGLAISNRYGQAIEVGSAAMNIRLLLTLADGSDAGNTRYQFNKEVMERLTMDGKMITGGILTG